MDLPAIPEWDGEPQELFATPDSHEASEEKSPNTAYALAHVLDDAGLYDPDFLDTLPL